MTVEDNIEENNKFHYLTFRLGEESYAIEITKVREVLDYTSTTKIPRTPEFMTGVINLRGNIVPVVDLRQILGMSPAEIGNETCVVITEIDRCGEQLVIGALADSVQEVMEISENAIDAPPKIGTRLRTEYLKGIGRKNDSFVMILNADKVLSVDALEGIDQTAATVPNGFSEISV